MSISSRGGGSCSIGWIHDVFLALFDDIIACGYTMMIVIDCHSILMVYLMDVNGILMVNILGVSLNGGTQNGWFIYVYFMDNLINMDGVPIFLETSMWIYDDDSNIIDYRLMV